MRDLDYEATQPRVFSSVPQPLPDSKIIVCSCGAKFHRDFGGEGSCWPARVAGKFECIKCCADARYCQHCRAFPVFGGVVQENGKLLCAACDKEEQERQISAAQWPQQKKEMERRARTETLKEAATAAAVVGGNALVSAPLAAVVGGLYLVGKSNTGGASADGMETRGRSSDGNGG